MGFCGMKREIDWKCLIHARVHANAQSFDRCDHLTNYGGKQTNKRTDFTKQLTSSPTLYSSSFLSTSIPSLLSAEAL